MTTLSVIIPCHNVARYVEPLAASLRHNLDVGYEFVFVDDGSTDETASVLERVTDRLPGARVITSPQNRGLSAARNLGLRHATGRYLTFLDGDDFLLPGYLPELVAAIRDLGADMIRTDHVQVRGRKRSVHRICHGPRGVVMSPRDAILPAYGPSSVDAPNAWAGIFDARLVQTGLLDFDETLRTCEDRPWCWRLHLGVDSFAVVGLHGLCYRREVSSSLTQLVDERQLDFLPAHDTIIAAVRADRDADRFLPKAAWAYCAVICHHLGQIDRFPRPLQDELQSRSRAALGRLEPGLLDEVITRLRPDRRTMIDKLLAGAWRDRLPARLRLAS